MIFLIADLHLGYKSIIEYCSRPFRSLTEMDTKLIENWNRVVNENDEVFVVGDFARKPRKFVDKFKGKIILIKGNHDPASISKYMSVYRRYYLFSLQRKRPEKVTIF